MSQDISAAQMLEAFKADAPGHVQETRWAHTHGLGVTGRFVPSRAATKYCVAGHFQKTLNVTARFSDGSSDPERHDERPDTRGLAVKYHYEDGSDHDLLAMTLNVFGAKTRQEFLGVSKAFVPKSVVPTSWLRRNILDPLMLRQAPPDFPKGVTSSGGPGLAKYSGSHEFVREFIIEAGLSQVPTSWARSAYHAVHTFVITDPQGLKRNVRFAWQPVDGVFPVPPEELSKKPSDFLTTELKKRLKHAPVRFTLRMTIADPGDALDDPSARWSVTRRTVAMGTLYIDKLAEETGIDVEQLSFNPMRMPPGIEASGDAILRARGEIYQLACGERNGTGCPVMNATQG